MGVSVQYPDPVKEDLFGLNDWGQIWSNCKEVGGSVDDLVAKLGSALEDALILLSISAPPLEGCEVCFVGKNKDCEELIINQDESLMLTSNTKLGENLSFPCSGNVLFQDVCVNGNDKISNAALDEHCSLESGNPMSLPANAASGMAVHDDCKLKFLELKAKRTYRFIVFKIEEKQKQVIVEKVGEPAESYEDFTASLPADECRYAVYDYDFVTEENCQKSRIFFIAWSPDTSRVRSKMIYASSKDRFKRELDGIQVELQATDPTEIGLDVIKSRVDK